MQFLFRIIQRHLQEDITRIQFALRFHFLAALNFRNPLRWDNHLMHEVTQLFALNPAHHVPFHVRLLSGEDVDGKPSGFKSGGCLSHGHSLKFH